ncbi:hypothetical protein [Paenibacillus flagellatus]|uniref:Uncharacterized protein n=2 Tax=Paenibacillaceae TaxID=186822 RepID=A0A2V5JUL0_9BACL|nr:hypothetical protein [Paenibacillus flagellatus]PYI50051.1 hypothetical protein DLM86_30860 [Paenibacillus flagellatus]
MKKVSMLLMSILMVLVFASSAMATPVKNTPAQDKHNAAIDAKKEKIRAKFEELGEYRANKLLQAAKNGTDVDPQQLDSTEVQLESDLQALGVNAITPAQAQAIANGGSDVSIQVTVPPSNSNVKWYDIRYTYYTGGTTYAVQELYAQGLAGGTNLAAGQNGVTLYTNKQILVKNVTYIAQMYAQKAIGTIPIVQWLPYEMLFSDNSQVTNNSHVITHRSLSTVCFSYVKLDGQSDNYQSLSYVSNMVSVASSHTLAGYNNGSPYSKTTDKSNTDYATNYASPTSAVNAYKDPYAPRQSFISFYRFYNNDQTASLTQYIINPSFPAQITQ